MSVSRRPRRFGSVLALLVASLAVAAVASEPGQRTALTVGTAGAIGLWAGIRWSRDSSLGYGLAILGVFIVSTGLVLGVTRTASVRTAVEVVPGLVGIATLAAGLGPIHMGHKRLVISAGTGLVLVAVLVSGAIRGASTLALLAGGGITVVAWDLAEQAVSLSEQVGEAAATHRVELVHGGATAGFAGLAVGTTWVVRGFDVTGLPLVTVLFLLAAAVTLTLVLYN